MIDKKSIISIIFSEWVIYKKKENNNMLRKRFFIATLSLMILAASLPVAAASSSLSYKNTTASAELVVDFNWAIFGSDDATATTDKATGDYPVAVRLELWENSSAYKSFKYDSDSSYAQCVYSWSDVYCYKSRHSIDNSAHTQEYAVKSLNEKE